ncbi:MAG: Na/Pi cotransporter family protein [Eubacteriales bacterium]|nr:Na/Pi cotransporter family protein [Eubacteriales bacterium]
MKTIIILLGGVAMFLFGMGLMGDGLKKVAGNKLELILYRLSNTTLKGLLLGTGVTAVIQSSAATSVMVVGFVNSQMMSLKQALSVILGAIIGTSVTGWVLCLSEIGGSSGLVSLLSTEVLSALVAIIGIVMRMTTKKKTTVFVSDILLGFSVLMFGMKSMSGAVSGLRDNPAFLGLLTGFKNPFLGVLFGLGATAVLQSASATVGILQALSVTGVITFDIAFPIILGIGIGAALPVLMSAVGSTTDGKRAAFSYLIMGLLNTIPFAIIFYVLNGILKFGFMGDTMNMVSIAMVNSLYRIITVIFTAPFIKPIERLLARMIKEKAEDSQNLKDISRLETKFLQYPPLALEQSRLVLVAMAHLAKKAIYNAVDLVNNYSEKGHKEIEDLEAATDKYEDKLGTYLMKITSADLTPEQSAKLSKYLHAITDLERIGDHALNIAQCAQEIHEKKIEFTPEGKREMEILASALLEAVTTSIKAFTEENLNMALMIEPLEQTIDDLCDDIKLHHIKRLQKGQCTLEHGYVFNDLLTNYERVSDHCSNIAVAFVETSENTLEIHEYEAKLRYEPDAEFREYFEEYKKKYHI